MWWKVFEGKYRFVKVEEFGIGLKVSATFGQEFFFKKQIYIQNFVSRFCFLP